MSEVVQKYLSEVEALAKPISDAAPQGADISYDAEFEVVRTEIDKLTTLAGETPNWRDIVASGEDLVATKSKDLRLLLWATAGRTRLDGIGGFARGLAGIKVVCEAHWDGMYPPIKRAKARGNLAQWLGDQVTPLLTAYQPKNGDKPLLEAISSLYGDIDELFSTKLGDAYTGMGPLRSLLRDKLREVPADAPPPAPAPAAAPAAAAPAAAAPVAAAPAAAGAAMAAPAMPTVTGAQDALPALRALGKGITDVARHLRSADPASAWAFRLARVGTWLAVKQPPPAEGGKTKIPPPQPADVKKLQGLVEAQQWGQLVAAGEEFAGRFLFWFDAHRYVALGLERQGALYQDAHAAVTAEVLAFIKANPQIPALAFADGTPFADEGTKTWIEEEQAKLGGGSGGGGSQKVDEEEQELRARFEEARELVTGGKVGEGLGLAMQLARRGSDARARYRARLEIAGMALKGGKSDLARPLLEGLVAEAEAHGLEHWEPELAARTYELLLKARTGSSGKGASQPPDQEVFDRLCRLDPAAAFKAAP